MRLTKQDKDYISDRGFHTGTDGPGAAWAFFALLVIGGILTWVAYAFSQMSSEGGSACAHEPHMGACKVTETIYQYNVTLNLVTPIFYTCGCTSDHGVRLKKD